MWRRLGWAQSRSGLLEMKTFSYITEVRTPKSPSRSKSLSRRYIWYYINVIPVCTCVFLALLSTQTFGFDACAIDDNRTRIRDVSNFVVHILTRHYYCVLQDIAALRSSTNLPTWQSWDFIMHLFTEVKHKPMDHIQPHCIIQHLSHKRGLILISSSTPQWSVYCSKK